MLGKSLDARPGRVAIVSADRNVLIANRAWRKFHARDDAAGFLEGCEDPSVRTVAQRVFEGRSRQASVRYSTMERDVRKQYRTHIERMEHEGIEWFIVSDEDITESESIRRAFVALADQLTNLQERERQRIARELHDSTSQHLAGVSLQLARLKRAMPFEGVSKEIMAEVNSLLHQAQDELRTFTYLLHPPELERLDFRSAIETLVSGFSERAGLDCRYRVDAVVDTMASDVKLAAFRVLQEALTNVYRHAHARRIFVLVRVEDGVLSLFVKDDGRGLPNGMLSSGGRAMFGVGIFGMQARMNLLGGTVSVTNGNRGTIVAASVPMRPHCDDAPSLDQSNGTETPKAVSAPKVSPDWRADAWSTTNGRRYSRR